MKNKQKEWHAATKPLIFKIISKDAAILGFLLEFKLRLLSAVLPSWKQRMRL